MTLQVREVVIWRIQRAENNERHLMVHDKAMKFARDNCFGDGAAKLEIAKHGNIVPLTKKSKIFGPKYIFTKLSIRVYENV